MYKNYFAAIEEVFQHYQGRPHWGNMHTLEIRDLQKVYPKFNDFLQTREQLDPQNILLSKYLKELLLIYLPIEQINRSQMKLLYQRQAPIQQY